MIHSGYSFKHAVGHLPNVLDRIKSIGWKIAPISDRISTFGFTRWTALCPGKDLHPVYGIELPVSANMADDQPTYDWWTFLAIDSIVPLHDLLDIATSSASRKEKNKLPALTYREAHAQEGVFKIGGASL